MRLLHGLGAEPASLEVGELTVVLEEVVRPDPLHDLDRLAHVRMPLGEDVGGTRGGELLGHPARADADVDAAAGEVVHGRHLRGEDAGGAIRRVDDAHADPHLRRLRGEPGDQRHALEQLAPRRHRQASGSPSIMPNEYWSSWRSEASGTTIRSSVQTESKSSSSARLVRSSSSLTRHLVAEVRQVESELHVRRPPRRGTSGSPDAGSCGAPPPRRPDRRAQRI